jgi:hypothetical protein
MKKTLQTANRSARYKRSEPFDLTIARSERSDRQRKHPGRIKAFTAMFLAQYNMTRSKPIIV